MDRQRFYEARSKVLNGEHVRAGIGTYGEKTVHAVLKNYFDALPNEVMESARIDGAGKGKIFTSIMMPIAIPGLAFVLIQTFLNAWNELQMAMIFINDTSVQPISVVPLRFTQTAGVQGFPLEVMYAALVVCLSPIAVFYFFGSRFLIEGLTQGAIKG